MVSQWLCHLVATPELKKIWAIFQAHLSHKARVKQQRASAETPAVLAFWMSWKAHTRGTKANVRRFGVQRTLTGRLVLEEWKRK